MTPLGLLAKLTIEYSLAFAAGSADSKSDADGGEDLGGIQALPARGRMTREFVAHIEDQLGRIVGMTTSFTVEAGVHAGHRLRMLYTSGRDSDGTHVHKHAVLWTID